MFLNPKDYEKTMAVKPVKEKTLQEIYDKTIRTLWSYRMPVVRIDYPASTPAEVHEPEVYPVWFNSDSRVSPALAMLEHDDIRLLRKTVGYDVLQSGFHKEDDKDDEWPVLELDKENVKAILYHRTGAHIQDGSYFGDILASYGPAYVSAIGTYLDALANRGIFTEKQIGLIFDLEARHLEWFQEYATDDFLTQTSSDIGGYHEWRYFHRSFIGVGDYYSLNEKSLLSIKDHP